MPFALGEHYAEENDLKKQVLPYLQARSELAWVARFNTGAHSVGTGKSRRFIRYAFPGCSDILGQFNTGHLLAIELKIDRRKPSEKQQAFIDLVNMGGGLGLAAWSIGEIADAIDGFLLRVPPLSQNPGIPELRRTLGL